MQSPPPFSRSLYIPDSGITFLEAKQPTSEIAGLRFARQGHRDGARPEPSGRSGVRLCKSKGVIMLARRLKEFLDKQNTKYISIQHSPAYTAQEVAASSHVPGRDFAKTVVVKIEDEFAMLVLPANRKVVLSDLREMLDVEKARLATEEEFQRMFPDCEVGAMPPFGNLYGIDVYVAPNLAAEKEIAFNAGTHTDVIKMAFEDFERLVQPRVLSFTT